MFARTRLLTMSRLRMPMGVMRLPVRFASAHAIAAGGASFSWTDNGSDSYDVGWDTSTHSSGDRNDPTLYPNRESVGVSTSWTNTEGVTVYAAVRSVVDGEVGPWSSERTLSA